MIFAGYWPLSHCALELGELKMHRFHIGVENQNDWIVDKLANAGSLFLLAGLTLISGCGGGGSVGLASKGNDFG